MCLLTLIFLARLNAMCLLTLLFLARLNAMCLRTFALPCSIETGKPIRLHLPRQARHDTTKAAAAYGRHHRGIPPRPERRVSILRSTPRLPPLSSIWNLSFLSSSFPSLFTSQILKKNPNLVPHPNPPLHPPLVCIQSKLVPQSHRSDDARTSLQRNVRLDCGSGARIASKAKRTSQLRCRA